MTQHTDDYVPPGERASRDTAAVAADAALPRAGLLPYAQPEFVYTLSLPTRLAFIFAAMVVPALVATAAWMSPRRGDAGSFAAAGAAVLFGAAALICCAAGYRRDRRRDVAETNRRPRSLTVLLVSSLLLGSAGVALGGGATLRAATSRTYGPSLRHVCQRNLRMTVLACIMYAHQNKGRMPDTLDDVLQAGEVTADVFVCPMQFDNPRPGGSVPYVYLGRGMKNDIGPEVVVLHDVPQDHADGMNFAYGDGHVEWHDATTSKKILAELGAGYNPPRPEKLR